MAHSLKSEQVQEGGVRSRRFWLQVLGVAACSLCVGHASLLCRHRTLTILQDETSLDTKMNTLEPIGKWRTKTIRWPEPHIAGDSPSRQQKQPRQKKTAMSGASAKTDKEPAKLELSAEKKLDIKIQASSKMLNINEKSTTETAFILYEDTDCKQKTSKHAIETGSPATLTNVTFLSSRVEGSNARVEVFHKGSYYADIVASEGCVSLNQYPSSDTQDIFFRLFKRSNQNSLEEKENHQQQHMLQQRFSTAPTPNYQASSSNRPYTPHTRIIFSTESTEYFRYQVHANALGFLQSNQTNTSWTRLLSARQPDDLAGTFPTFTAPKSLYSNRYTPMNKPDIIDKWFQSDQAPHPDDTIVVIDGDNWLLKDVHPWTSNVTQGHGVGQQPFYFLRQPLADRMWQEFCPTHSNGIPLFGTEEYPDCTQPLDLTAVPYVLKASDLQRVAPLWRHYSRLVHQKTQSDPKFLGKYQRLLDVQWCAEMFGFNFATAHLGISMTIVKNLQVRDTHTNRNWNAWEDRPMIHMGRAWFPKEAAKEALKWNHGLEFPEYLKKKGIPVWAKWRRCAGGECPWPMPPNMDFVSFHTLRLLHESKDYFKTAMNEAKLS